MLDITYMSIKYNRNYDHRGCNFEFKNIKVYNSLFSNNKKQK